MKNILIAGGAGYIGSHSVLDFLEHNYNVIVLDNLSEGHKEAVKSKYFEKVDLADKKAIDDVFKKYQIDAVIHFAAYAYVGESVINPSKYYNNNLINTINLLDTMVENNVKNIVFSSTCATYGEPEYLPIDENHLQKPINPYGKTKFMIENIFEDYHKAYGLNYMSLRYFNASGAHENGEIGESHNVETHLIPLILKTLTGERDNIKVFGDDYDTPDGTCIRDYIHVNDLAVAHRFALEKLFAGAQSDCINLGTGMGNSVLEVIKACEEVAGKKVPYTIDERREGDPARLVASNQKAKDVLGWLPEYKDIKDIIRTAWNWEKERKF